ncbi:hypothetical protein PV416_01105 [Streptomyces ipomoeae]|nr:hypothetical protein [Streptomyces ipomoeae]MDX2819715.1 hypothetical protein [Streptomyces ipomoeae]MDX2838106.1 hypothetical protein [Streptomyces ipomoeae]MDX2876174.1 hypothetical protein [Streptomyces ipomoeae]
MLNGDVRAVGQPRRDWAPRLRLVVAAVACKSPPLSSGDPYIDAHGAVT